jgi:hypothetical protein
VGLVIHYGALTVNRNAVTMTEPEPRLLACSLEAAASMPVPAASTRRKARGTPSVVVVVDMEMHVLGRSAFARAGKRLVALMGLSFV